MAFKFSESHLADYASQGYTIFRSIIPPALIRDLRKEANRGRELARAASGPQAQRLQPIANYDLDPRPFHDYAQLSELNDAIRRVVGPHAWYGDLDRTAILLEPARAPWCTAWHRDITAASPGVEPVEFAEIRTNINYFNQTNCALYDDSCTWYIPGSHCRDDVPGELEHVPHCPTPVHEGMPGGNIDEVILETRCLEYARTMPRAICLHLGAGDFALYQPLGWHIGNYVPYRIRATICDTVWTEPAKAWYQRWDERRKQ